MRSAKQLIVAFVSWFVVFSFTQAKFPLDFDDTDFYLTSRKGGPPSAVIEDIRRGQEGVLVKLRQVTNELENDELKLNNIFYKLGHHDTELKSVANGIGRLSASGRKTETKLNKHAFNVEFLHRQVKELQAKLGEENESQIKILSLQKTVDHLEDRLAEVLLKLSMLNNSTHLNQVPRQAPAPKNQFALVAEPSTLVHYPLRDEAACSIGWELLDGLCFFISTEKKSFKDAVSACSAIGAQLLSLTEVKKDVFLRRVINRGHTYWTSGTDIFSQNQWSFLLSGESIPRELWAKPSEGYLTVHKDNHCATVTKDGLQATKCGHRVAYICEKL